MKKGLSILFSATLLTGFTSCGMSEEERKADSMQQDSVIAENDDLADSLAKMMERENFVMDSTAKADSTAAADSAAKAGK
jgi:hypothetical protein